MDRVEPVEPVTVVQGSLVTLTCEARGVPPPTLTWMKDGQPLSLHRNLLLDGQETRLQLPDVTPSDAGLYSCVASNQAGSSTKSFNLTVLGTSKNKCYTRDCGSPLTELDKITLEILVLQQPKNDDDDIRIQMKIEIQMLITTKHLYT